MIAIETALVRPDMRKLPLYEPPHSFDGAALAAMLKATGDRGVLRLVPEFSSRVFSTLRSSGRQPAVAPGRPIAPGVDPHPPLRRPDGGARRGRTPRAVLEARLRRPLLGGSNSARSLTASLFGLSEAPPGARRVVLRGAGHTASDNHGQPGCVVARLRAFFA